MPPSSATADWEVLEDKYYRKVLLYSELFNDDHDLNNYVIAGAPYSGAIGSSLSAPHPPRKADAHQLCTETTSSSKSSEDLHS
jgi:hypothetical protein